MNLYLDTSALIKRYVAERESNDTIELIESTESVAISIVTRAEVAAALAKLVRLGSLSAERGQEAQTEFISHWAYFARIGVTEALVSTADTLAWDYALRGYDAIQLASALMWQESVGMAVTLATFDRQLWEAGHEAGLQVWPAKLRR